MGVLPAKRKRNQQTEAAAVPDALQRRSNAGQRADRGGAQEAGETRICDQKGGWSAGDLLEAPAGQPQFCPGPSMASEEAQKGSKDNGPKATQPKRKRSHHEQGDALERFIKQTAKSQRLDFSPAPVSRTFCSYSSREHDEEQRNTTQAGANKDEIPLKDDEAPSTEACNVNQARAARETPAQTQAQSLMEDETIPEENISYKPPDASNKFM
ncbi:hypothetical protein TGAM01_v202194 [Trichoderma gamsii]|uniref:Uncharacterized protein n=1 Tax=Trichoderma gamsii TaxID=398673 RepID=A0A2P4ZXS8_9HYPO|nr:hypothetical protein TGAM01_v202194 [Trichoderma gamsii]PON29086.1 hypothetical protein TGAM01_v202194 [Trichoderma gamsii]